MPSDSLYMGTAERDHSERKRGGCIPEDPTPKAKVSVCRTDSTVLLDSAKGRTVTWYRSLPNYVMLHLVYHWNKNPKKL